MRVIVAGGRDFVPTAIHEEWLKHQFKKLNVTELVCGMAHGADEFGYSIATELNIPIKEFPALWAIHGKIAGFKRNEEMAVYVSSDDPIGHCILFRGGNGTAHMRKMAKKYKIEIIECDIVESQFSDSELDRLLKLCGGDKEAKC